MHCRAYKNKVDEDFQAERERERERERALDLAQASLEETIDHVMPMYTYVASLSMTRPVYTAHT